MLSNFNRRNFIKTGGLLSAGVVFGGPSILWSCRHQAGEKEILQFSPDLGDASNSILSPSYAMVDNYLPNELLVQGVEFTLNSGNDYKAAGGFNLVYYCHKLIIDGTFSNPSGNVTIFCNELVCVNSATIDVSGKAGIDCATREPSTCNGDHPDANNADNLVDGRRPSIDGSNGGTCTIYFSSIQGDIAILARGGQGAKGEDGAFACDGRDGLAGLDVIHNAYCSTIRQPTIGENGKSPGKNGNGAPGGNGGRGGNIQIFSNNGFAQEDGEETGSRNFVFGKSSVKGYCSGGNGGNGGSGGSANAHGGHGGQGGMVLLTRQVGGGGDHGSPNGHCEGYTLSTSRLPNGIDRYNEVSPVGTEGAKGFSGANASPSASSDYFGLAYYLPSSFVTILFLNAEDLYLNGSTDESAKILAWINAAKEKILTEKIVTVNSNSYTTYLDPEPSDNLSGLFTLSELRLNQISLGVDYFGNITNYVTVLDSEFINDRISAQISTLSAIESTTKDLLSTDQNYSSAAKTIETHKDQLSTQIDSLKNEMTNLYSEIEKLNADIFERDNQIGILENRIQQKQQAFMDAVNGASQGCTLTGTLSALSKVVSLTAGIASGFGAISAGINLLSDTASLKNNFISKVDAVGPWLNPGKWKQVFNSGGSSNLISRIDTVKRDAENFRSNINTFKEAVADDTKGEKKVLISTDIGLPAAQESKEQFKAKLSAYINDFPQAKVYEDEVLAFIDFCDETNKKRVDYTSRFHEAYSLLEQITNLQREADSLSSDLQKDQSQRISSKTKINVISSYLSTRNYLVKLIYLQSKAIDYFTLQPKSFNVSLFSLGISGLSSNYINDSQARLVQYLATTGFGRTKTKTSKPIVISQNDIPDQFERLKAGEPSIVDPSKKRHVLNFDIQPVEKYFLGDKGSAWSEIFAISCRLKILGLNSSEKDTNVSINLKHNGNPMFVTSSREFRYFSHRPVLKQLEYNVDTGDYMADKEFSNITGDYLVDNKSPYLGVSPFASWTLIIDESIPSNHHLVFENVNGISIDFEFYYLPFAL